MAVRSQRANELRRSLPRSAQDFCRMWGNKTEASDKDDQSPTCDATRAEQADICLYGNALVLSLRYWGTARLYVDAPEGEK
jgi:hypothetical protein